MGGLDPRDCKGGEGIIPGCGNVGHTLEKGQFEKEQHQVRK
jgi:hypothetical protein